MADSGDDMGLEPYVPTERTDMILTELTQVIKEQSSVIKEQSNEIKQLTLRLNENNGAVLGLKTEVKTMSNRIVFLEGEIETLTGREFVPEKPSSMTNQPATPGERISGSKSSQSMVAPKSIPSLNDMRIETYKNKPWGKSPKFEIEKKFVDMANNYVETKATGYEISSGENNLLAQALSTSQLANANGKVDSQSLFRLMEARNNGEKLGQQAYAEIKDKGPQLMAEFIDMFKLQCRAENDRLRCLHAKSFLRGLSWTRGPINDRSKPIMSADELQLPSPNQIFDEVLNGNRDFRSFMAMKALHPYKSLENAQSVALNDTELKIEEQPIPEHLRSHQPSMLRNAPSKRSAQNEHAANGDEAASVITVAFKKAKTPGIRETTPKRNKNTSPEQVLEKTWKCKLCDNKQIAHNSDVKALRSDVQAHLQKIHKLSLQEYAMLAKELKQ